MERLRTLYEMYFMGIEKLEPLVPKKDVERRMATLRKEQIRNTGLRYKFNMILQRLNTYTTYWQRIARQIEQGTYKRDVMRAQARFGVDPTKERPAEVERETSEREERAAPLVNVIPDDGLDGLEDGSAFLEPLDLEDDPFAEVAVPVPAPAPAAAAAQRARERFASEVRLDLGDLGDPFEEHDPFPKPPTPSLSPKMRIAPRPGAPERAPGGRAARGRSGPLRRACAADRGPLGEPGRAAGLGCPPCPRPRERAARDHHEARVDPRRGRARFRPPRGPRRQAVDDDVAAPGDVAGDRSALPDRSSRARSGGSCRRAVDRAARGARHLRAARRAPAPASPGASRPRGRPFSPARSRPPPRKPALSAAPGAPRVAPATSAAPPAPRVQAPAVSPPAVSAAPPRLSRAAVASAPAGHRLCTRPRGRASPGAASPPAGTSCVDRAPRCSGRARRGRGRPLRRSLRRDLLEVRRDAPRAQRADARDHARGAREAALGVDAASETEARGDADRLRGGGEGRKDDPPSRREIGGKKLPLLPRSELR